MQIVVIYFVSVFCLYYSSYIFNHHDYMGPIFHENGCSGEWIWLSLIIFHYGSLLWNIASLRYLKSWTQFRMSWISSLLGLGVLDVMIEGEFHLINVCFPWQLDELRNRPKNTPLICFDGGSILHVLSQNFSLSCTQLLAILWPLVSTALAITITDVFSFSDKTLLNLSLEIY